MSDLLDRAAILTAVDLPTEDVPVPEWGGTVRIRGLTAGERDAFEAENFERAQPARRGRPLSVAAQLTDLRARLVQRCAVDPQGARLFGEGDIAALSAKSAAAVDRCFAVAQRLSGLGPKDLEDFAGNFEPGRVDGSSSG